MPDRLAVPQETVPNPDPSVVTTLAIEKAVTGAFNAISTRIDGMQKAIDVFQADLTRVPTAVDRAILGLRELQDTRFKAVESDVNHNREKINRIDLDIVKEIGHLHALMMTEVEKQAAVTTEKFLGVAAQFSERDTRTDQRAGDTKLAVDAAFAAAKETTAKSESNFTKQIDAMVNIIDTKTGNLAGSLSDLKDRMTAIENRTAGMSVGKNESRIEAQDVRGMIFGAIGIVIGLAAIIIPVVVHLSK